MTECNCEELRAIVHGPCRRQQDSATLRSPILPHGITPRAKGQRLSSAPLQGLVPHRGDCPLHGNVLGVILTTRCSQPFCTAADMGLLNTATPITAQKTKKKKNKNKSSQNTKLPTMSPSAEASAAEQNGQGKQPKTKGSSQTEQAVVSSVSNSHKAGVAAAHTPASPDEKRLETTHPVQKSKKKKAKQKNELNITPQTAAATDEKAQEKSPASTDLEKKVKSAAKSLRKLQRKMDEAMKTSEDNADLLVLGVEELTNNREKVEKALKDHVSRLHALVDQLLQEHLDSLRQRHKEHLQNVLVARTQEMNYQGRLAHVQKEAEKLQNHLTEQRDVTSDPQVGVTALRTKFNLAQADKPATKVPRLTFAVEIPEAIAAMIDALLGRFVFVEEFLPHTLPSSTPAKDKAISTTSDKPQLLPSEDCSCPGGLSVLQLCSQSDFQGFCLHNVGESAQSEFTACDLTAITVSTQTDGTAPAQSHVPAPVQYHVPAPAQSHVPAPAQSHVQAPVQSHVQAPARSDDSPHDQSVRPQTLSSESSLPLHSETTVKGVSSVAAHISDTHLLNLQAASESSPCPDSYSSRSSSTRTCLPQSSDTRTSLAQSSANPSLNASVTDSIAIVLNLNNPVRTHPDTRTCLAQNPTTPADPNRIASITDNAASPNNPGCTSPEKSSTDNHASCLANSPGVNDTQCPDQLPAQSPQSSGDSAPALSSHRLSSVVTSSSEVDLKEEPAITVDEAGDERGRKRKECCKMS